MNCFVPANRQWCKKVAADQLLSNELCEVLALQRAGVGGHYTSKVLQPSGVEWTKPPGHLLTHEAMSAQEKEHGNELSMKNHIFVN